MKKLKATFRSLKRRNHLIMLACVAVLGIVFCWHAYIAYQASKTVNGRFATIRRITGFTPVKDQQGKLAVSVSDVCYANTWSFKTGETWKKQCVRRETRYFDVTGDQETFTAQMELLSRNGWEVYVPGDAFYPNDTAHHEAVQVDVWNGGWARGGIEKVPGPSQLLSSSNKLYQGPLPAGHKHLAIAMAIDEQYFSE